MLIKKYCNLNLLNVESTLWLAEPNGPKKGWQQTVTCMRCRYPTERGLLIGGPFLKIASALDENGEVFKISVDQYHCSLILMRIDPNMPQTAVILSHGPTLLNDIKMSSLPKILLPVGGRMLLEYQAALLASVGVKQVIICVQCEDEHIGERMERILSPYPFGFRCITQRDQRGTGGTLKELESLIDDRFWLLSGDLFLFADLAEMLFHHRQTGSSATVGAVHVEESGWEMERVETGAGHEVKAIHRIHPFHDRRSKLRPVGIYLFEKLVLDHIRSEGYFDVKEQLFRELGAKGHSTKVWEICGYCKNLSGFDKYFELQEDILLKRAGLTGLDQWLTAPTMPAPANISSKAVLVGPVVVGKNCTIEDGAVIVGPTSIGNGSVIQRNAVVAESILFQGASVGESAHIRKCFLGEGTQVGPHHQVNDTIILQEAPSAPQVSRPLPWSFYGSPSPGFQCQARLRCAENHSNRKYLKWKRVSDIAISVVALILSAPIMAVIAVAVKLDSPGRIIFSQRRCGKGGVEFSMYKFRSMVESAEQMKSELMLRNEVDGPMFKITNDPRTTRVGWLLRATNLDELPQFWNVLRGDMSVVGPRPLSWDEMRYNPSWRDSRILVLPGIIGLWQIQSHQKTSFSEWVVLDMYYVENISMWLDIKILLKSAFVLPVTAAKGMFHSVIKGFKRILVAHNG